MKTSAQRLERTEIIELVPEVLHLKKILVPIDFSDTAKKAAQYALRFAEQFGCEIALLYVVEPATPMVGAPLAVEVFTDKDEFSMAEKDLAALAAESRTNGAQLVTSFVRVGHAPNEITKTAIDHAVNEHAARCTVSGIFTVTDSNSSRFILGNISSARLWRK